MTTWYQAYFDLDGHSHTPGCPIRSRAVSPIMPVIGDNTLLKTWLQEQLRAIERERKEYTDYELIDWYKWQSFTNASHYVEALAGSSLLEDRELIQKIAGDLKNVLRVIALLGFTLDRVITEDVERMRVEK